MFSLELVQQPTIKRKKSGCDDMIENSNKDYNAFSFDKCSEEEMNEEDIDNLDEEKETKKINENTHVIVHSKQITSTEENSVENTVPVINRNTNISAHETGNTSIINDEFNDDIPCRQIDYYDNRNRDVLDSLIYQRELDFESVGLNLNSYCENHELFDLYTRIQTDFDQAILDKDKIIEDLNLKILDLKVALNLN